MPISLIQEKIKVLEWCSQSLGLNITENLWRDLKNSVQGNLRLFLRFLQGAVKRYYIQQKNSKSFISTREYVTKFADILQKVSKLLHLLYCIHIFL